MKTILTRNGARALSRSVVNGVAVSFLSFRIGSSFGFSPSVTASDVDKFVYEGDSSQIDVNFGVNPRGNGVNSTIFNVELTLDHTIGDFEIGNVMLFDQSGRGFAFGVRESAIPKFRSRRENLGSEIIIQFPIRILTEETPANVTTTVTRESSVPTVSSEQGLINTDSRLAEFPVYVVENFLGRGTPALLYASSQENIWWANPFFGNLNNLDFDTISGGRVGDGYQNPQGLIIFGGSFGDSRSNVTVLGGGSFSDDLSLNSEE